MAEVRNVSVADALALLEGGALLLDVREVIEWDLGHAPQAVHVPLAEVPDRVDTMRADQLVVCVCRSGIRSARAAEFLLEQGLEAVNLAGGMLAWLDEGVPLVSDHGDPDVH